MDDYNRIMGQVRGQISNTQSKINMYFGQPPAPYSVPCDQMPSSPLPRQSVQSIYSPLSASHANYSVEKAPNPSRRSDPNPLNPFCQSQQPIVDSTQGHPLSPKILALSQEQCGRLRIQHFQRDIIKEQIQQAALRKNKENCDRIIENSSQIQNQIDHYPYGMVHTNMMHRIINQRTNDDKNNEETLLRFQRQAQQYKRSKSKFIKNLQDTRTNTDQLDWERTSQPIKIRRVVPKPLDFGDCSDNQKSSKKKVSFDETHIEPNQNYPQQRQPADNSSVSSFTPETCRKAPPAYLQPITSEGEDGLMLIKRNLRQRLACQTQTRRRFLNNYQMEDSLLEQESAEQIKESIKDIAGAIHQMKSVFENAKGGYYTPKAASRRVADIPEQMLDDEPVFKPKKVRQSTFKFRNSNNNNNDFRENYSELTRLNDMFQ